MQGHHLCAVGLCPFDLSVLLARWVCWGFGNRQRQRLVCVHVPLLCIAIAAQAVISHGLAGHDPTLDPGPHGPQDSCPLHDTDVVCGCSHRLPRRTSVRAWLEPQASTTQFGSAALGACVADLPASSARDIVCCPGSVLSPPLPARHGNVAARPVRCAGEALHACLRDRRTKVVYIQCASAQRTGLRRRAALT